MVLSCLALFCPALPCPAYACAILHATALHDLALISCSLHPSPLTSLLSHGQGSNLLGKITFNEDLPLAEQLQVPAGRGGGRGAGRGGLWREVSCREEASHFSCGFA